jgi:AcrR family transcriptional regulator
MSPKALDPTVRVNLIEAAARLLVEEGASALSTRRLAAEVGASTMAVYTYFSGMDELRLAVRKEGFDRFGNLLSEVQDTDDQVADVAAQGAAYFINALTNPHLYRFMFMEPHGEGDDSVGLWTFERLVSGVQRAIDAGRFAQSDAWSLATQLWAAAHGIVTLHLAGLLTLEDTMSTFEDIALNLFVGFGDDRSRAEASIEEARARVSGAIDVTALTPMG